MENTFFFTPYFLDQYNPQLAAQILPNWGLNQVVLPEGSQQNRMAACYQPIAHFACRAVQNGQRPVSIAGDCCTAIAFMGGLQRAGLDPLLVWLDAHGDFNTWETTPSGFIGGMPLAMLAGRGEQTLLQAVGLQPLPEERLALCDGRDLDPAERLALQSSRVLHLADLRDLPAHPLVQRPLYIHFDTDFVNPIDSPGMAYLAPGGPRAAEIKAVFQQLAQSHTIAGVSLSTWRPDLDPQGISRSVSLELLSALIQEPC